MGTKNDTNTFTSSNTLRNVHTDTFCAETAESAAASEPRMSAELDALWQLFLGGSDGGGVMKGLFYKKKKIK